MSSRPALALIALLLNTSVLLGQANINPVEPVYYLNSQNSPESTVIHLKQRAQDFAEAYQALKASTPTSKIYVIVKGQSFDKIEDFQVMENGTLVVITIKVPRGTVQKVVRVEEIDDLGVRR